MSCDWNLFETSAHKMMRCVCFGYLKVNLQNWFYFNVIKYCFFLNEPHIFIFSSYSSQLTHTTDQQLGSEGLF